jgi:two-component system cell cycle sensor histidine kinase PleC
MMMQEDVRRGVYEAPALLGPDDMYTYYESSSRYPYILFLGYEPERSREAVVRLLFPRLLQLAVIAGFLILILWVVRKRIIRPVWILAEHTREIMRTGRFEHDPSDDPSEIVELSNAIRQLARYFEEQKRIETELSLKNRELNKIREAAEITNRVKADFFEQVGTSLMVPANMISEYTESMRNELFGPFGNPKYKEMAEAIHEETHHITEILEDISVISRAESGLLTLNDAPLDVQFVIKKCLRLLRDKPPFQHVEIISDVQDDLPRLAADELRIKQVLLNLLTCAARQIEQEDVIRIFARMRQEQMLIEISYVTSADAGRPEMTTGHAVQPQPRPARSRDHVAGTASLGLGFALSQLIVSMHEGEITVKTMPDRSTRIELVFPAKRVV